jgi:hypothetical protein
VPVPAEHIATVPLRKALIDTYFMQGPTEAEFTYA